MNYEAYTSTCYYILALYYLDIGRLSLEVFAIWITLVLWYGDVTGESAGRREKKLLG